MSRLPPLAAFLSLAGATAALPANADEIAPDIPACPLLSSELVATAFGQAVAETERPPVGGSAGQGRMTTCFWTPADGGLGATVSLLVWSWPEGHPAAEGFLEAVRLADHPNRPAPAAIDVGEAALWDGDRLHVRQGSVGFTLAASLNALDVPPDAEAKLVALGREVVERLP